MVWDETVRMAAARFFDQAGHCHKAAGALLTTHLKGDAPARPGQFCKFWWQVLKETGHVKNRGKGGRPQKVPKPTATKISDAIIASVNSSSGGAYYCSIQEVLNQNPSLKEEVERLHVHSKTVERAVLRVNKEICKRRVKIQMELTPQQQEARRKFAAAMRRAPLYKRKAMVFIDESSLDLKQEGKALVYALKKKRLRPVTKKKATKKAMYHVHYVAAVMHGVGAVAFIPLTGTTGISKNYKVGLSLLTHFSDSDTWFLAKCW